MRFTRKRKWDRRRKTNNLARRRRLAETLEPRMMLAANALEGVFAQLTGQVDPTVDHGIKSVEVDVRSDQLSISRGKAILGFVVQSGDDAWQPSSMQFFDTQGNFVDPLLSRQPHANSRLVLLELADGQYRIDIGLDGLSTASTFMLSSYLVGDIDGDADTDADDMNQLRSLYGQFETEMPLAVDANQDGRVTLFDMNLARRNERRSASHTAAGFVPIASGGVERATGAVTPVGQYDETLPGQFIELDDGTWQQVAAEPSTGLSISNVTITEGDDGQSMAVFHVRLSEPVAHTVTVDYQTNPVTANAGEDFSPRSGTLSFAPGSIRQAIEVPILADEFSEQTELFHVELFAASGARVVDSVGEAWIFDDDENQNDVLDISKYPIPSIHVDDIAIDPRSDAAYFTITMAKAVSYPVSLNYQTLGGTARAGQDYQQVNDRVTIRAGQTSAKVGVPILTDEWERTSEWFTLRLYDLQHGNPVAQTAWGTIEADDLFVTDEPRKVSEFVGILNRSSEVDQLDIRVTRKDGMGGDVADEPSRLAFHLFDRDGNHGLDPAQVRLIAESGEEVDVVFAENDWLGNEDSLLVADVLPGNYRMEIRGQTVSRQQYQIDVYGLDSRSVNIQLGESISDAIVVPSTGYSENLPMRFFESAAGALIQDGGGTAEAGGSDGLVWPGNRTYAFTWTYREASYTNSLSVFRVDDASGQLLRNGQWIHPDASEQYINSISDTSLVFDGTELKNPYLSGDGHTQMVTIPADWPYFSVRLGSPDGTWYPYSSLNSDDYGHFEGLGIEDLDVSKHNRDGEPDHDDMVFHAEAAFVDVDVDSNNDGVVTEADDILIDDGQSEKVQLEEQAPGKILAVGQDQRKEVKLNATIPSAINSGYTVSLSFGSHIKLFKSGPSAAGSPPSEDEILAGELTDSTQLTIDEVLAGVTVYMDGVSLGADSITLEVNGTINILVDNEEEEQVAATEDVTLTDFAVVNVALDLDIDSDNNDGFSTPERSDLEEQLETQAGATGKLVRVNLNDSDGDAIPDFADPIVDGEHFVPVVIDFGSVIDPSIATVRFEYSDSDPSDITTLPSGEYSRPVGASRIWGKDSYENRNFENLADGGDFIAATTTYAVSSLAMSDGVATVFLEGIAASDDLGDQEIIVHVDPDGPTGPLGFEISDSIRTTNFDFQFVRVFDEKRLPNRSTRAVDWPDANRQFEDNPRSDYDKTSVPGIVIAGWGEDMSRVDITIEASFTPSGIGDSILWNAASSNGVMLLGPTQGTFDSGSFATVGATPSTSIRAVHEHRDDIVVSVGFDDNGDGVLQDSEKDVPDFGNRVIGKAEYDYCLASLDAWWISAGGIWYGDVKELLDIFMGTNNLPDYDSMHTVTQTFGGTHQQSNASGFDETVNLSSGNIKEYVWDSDSDFSSEVLENDDFFETVVRPAVEGLSIGQVYANNPALLENLFVVNISRVVEFSEANDPNLHFSLKHAHVTFQLFVYTERGTTIPEITGVSAAGSATDLYDFRTYGEDSTQGWASRIQAAHQENYRDAGEVFSIHIDLDVPETHFWLDVFYDDMEALKSKWQGLF
ncbi:Calx-beta domain protein [Novipirellula aureliae]|uniref:Calx-beta domain protein n=1 Tax=Novipirellula aureliae TaxID=2527966 RepID=A0A5C6E3M8_9BACT|nr:Calx-beta domain-containing protein [Novipirellula aureliae]TWU43305.1 Calx-beta domain protein [Novipirellula aureliae]